MKFTTNFLLHFVLSALTAISFIAALILSAFVLFGGLDAAWMWVWAVAVGLFVWLVVNMLLFVKNVSDTM